MTVSSKEIKEGRRRRPFPFLLLFFFFLHCFNFYHKFIALLQFRKKDGGGGGEEINTGKNSAAPHSTTSKCYPVGDKKHPGGNERNETASPSPLSSGLTCALFMTQPRPQGFCLSLLTPPHFSKVPHFNGSLSHGHSSGLPACSLRL